VLTLVLHELTHGLLMRYLEQDPSTASLERADVLSTSPGYAYHRNAYIVIALAPFVLISLLVILECGIAGNSMGGFIGICGTINASGAIGDLWITMMVVRYAARLM